MALTIRYGPFQVFQNPKPQAFPYRDRYGNGEGQKTTQASLRERERFPEMRRSLDWWSFR
jgi:hypothetical protein